MSDMPRCDCACAAYWDMKLREAEADRDEWKESTIMANERFKRAEAVLKEANKWYTMNPLAEENKKLIAELSRLRAMVAEKDEALHDIIDRNADCMTTLTATKALSSDGSATLKLLDAGRNLYNVGKEMDEYWNTEPSAMTELEIEIIGDKFTSALIAYESVAKESE